MTNSTDTAHRLIDVHDMVVVHRAFRREFALIPRLIRAVAAGDLARAATVAGHTRRCLQGLHLHHTGEDDLLWPKLLERAAPETELILRMEAQHLRVEELVDLLGPAVDRWEAEARPAAGEEVARLVEDLRTALLEHLDDEEVHILPIAARHITQPEWDELGEHGLAQVPKAELPITVGMVLEEATPAERADILGKAPAPARLLLRTLGAWQYRRYVRSVRGPITPSAA